MTAPQRLPVAGKIGDDNQQARNRTHVHYTNWFTGDGTTTRFPLAFTPRDVSQVMVLVDGMRKRPADRGVAYDFSLSGTVIVFTTPPANTKHVCVDGVI